jgi:hypothetical protein
MGVIATPILAGLASGAAGSAAGAANGTPIDQNLFNSLRCQACGHVFDASRVDPFVT